MSPTVWSRPTKMQVDREIMNIYGDVRTEVCPAAIVVEFWGHGCCVFLGGALRDVLQVFDDIRGAR